MAKVISVKSAVAVCNSFEEFIDHGLHQEERDLDLLHDMALWNLKNNCAEFMSYLDTIEWKYDRNQPRVGAGNPDGGQWTNNGGGSGSSGRSASYNRMGKVAEPKKLPRASNDNFRLVGVENDNRFENDISENSVAYYEQNVNQDSISNNIADKKPKETAPKVDGKITGHVSDFQPTDGEPPIEQINIFVGGYKDHWENNLAVAGSSSLRKETFGSNYYFHEDDGSKIEELISTIPSDKAINLVGHSYGGDTAAKVVEKLPKKISKLITIDPVSQFLPDFEKVRNGATHWINVNAVGNPKGGNSSNFVANVGGKWGDSVNRYSDMYYEAPYNHVEFNNMMHYNPSAKDPSMQQILNRGRK